MSKSVKETRKPAKPPRYTWGRFGLHSTALPVAEYKFHASRKWRFDYAWPLYRIAAEIDGGCFARGRHSRGAGQIKDNEKLNHAAFLGWRVFRFIPEQVESGYAERMILSAIAGDIAFSEPTRPVSSRKAWTRALTCRSRRTG